LGSKFLSVGALHQDEFAEILESSPGVDNDVVELLDDILALALDIQDDSGQCNSISAGVIYSGAEIYLMD